MVEGADEKNASTALFVEQLKSWLVVVPIIGAILALTFNVGYYVGVDINYFSFFSISEHIVFSLEAMPVALAVALGLSLVATLTRQGRTSEAGLIIFCAIAASIGLALWYFNRRFIDLFFSAIMLSVAIARWRGAGRIAIVSLLGIAMLIFIFQMGYDVGEGYVNGTVPTHVLNDNVYGRLIRAGERGVLFVSREPKAIVFRRWDDIRSIRTIELSKSDKEKIKSEARKLFSRF